MTEVQLYRVTLRRVKTMRFNDPIVRPTIAVQTARRLLGDWDREGMVTMFLDAQNQLLGAQIVSVGNLNTTRTTPRELFKGAILAGAFGIVLAHNHPSGCLDPSDEDLEFTRVVRRAGELIGIELFDHLIITERGYFSLRERGLI